MKKEINILVSICHAVWWENYRQKEPLKKPKTTKLRVWFDWACSRTVVEVKATVSTFNSQYCICFHLMLHVICIECNNKTVKLSTHPPHSTGMVEVCFHAILRTYNIHQGDDYIRIVIWFIELIIIHENKIKWIEYYFKYRTDRQ